MSVAIDFNDAGLQIDPDRIPDISFLSARDSLAVDMLAHGYQPERIDPTPKDGVSRFRTKDDKGADTAGWYVFYDDGKFPYAIYGDWRSGAKYEWSGYDRSSLSPEELAEEARRREMAEAARKAERDRKRAACRLRAANDWNLAEDCHEHPYLTAKGVASHGLKELNGNLLVPLLGPDGAIRSLQTITATGEKRYYLGTEKNGSFYRLEGSSVLAVCEGYATGATIHEATGWTVHIAFDAGNLRHVARWLREQNPAARIVVCGDDDRFKSCGNAGRMAAEGAARNVDGVAIFPRFANDAGYPTDWNDLCQREGLERAREQLLAVNVKRSALEAIIARERNPTKSYIFDPPPPLEWVFADTVMSGTPFIICGAGGTGKTSIGLTLAASIAIGRPLLGPVFTPEKTGSVLVLLCEDPELPIRTRVYQLGQKLGYEERCLFAEKVHIWPCLGDDMRLVRDVAGQGLVRTPVYGRLIEACKAIDDLVAVFIDPLNLLHGADLEKNEEAAQFFCSALAAAGQETGAAFFIVHHSVKNATNRGKSFDLSEALHADTVRGTGAIVAGMRGAANFAIMPPSVAKKQLGLRLLPAEGEYLAGKISKNNYGRLSGLFYARRDEHGLLDPVEPEVAPEEAQGISTDLMLRVTQEIRNLAEKHKLVTRNTFVNTYYNQWKIKKTLLTAAIDKCLLEDWLYEELGQNSNNVKAKYLYVNETEVDEDDNIMDFND